MKKCKGKSNISIVQDYLAGVRPFTEISMHVSEKDKYRKEGEKWTDSDGIEWQRKNNRSIRLTKTQGDIIREAIDDGLDCVDCGAKWKWCNTINRKMISRTSRCMDCLVDYETKLRILGIYDEYEKYRLAMYELGHLKEMKLNITETLEYFKRTGGDIVRPAESEYDPAIVWKNTNQEKIVKDAKADLKRVTALIKKGTKMTATFKQNYLSAIAKYNIKDIISK